MGLEKDLKIIKDAGLDIELLHRDNEKKCAENNAEIANLEEKIKSTEFVLEEELKASGEKKLECKLGYCSFRVMPDKWEYGEGAIDDIKHIYPEHFNRYIKVTEILIKTNIKEDVLSGKIGLPSLKVTPQEPKFNYKIKWGDYFWLI